MSGAPAIAVLGLSLFFSFYFSGVETGCYTLNRLRLRYRTERGERAARILSGLLSHMDILVPTILLGNNVVNYLATAVVTDLFSAALRDPARAEIATTAVVTPVLFFACELLPKEVFRIGADTLLYRAAGSIRLFIGIFLPFTLALRGIVRILSKAMGLQGAPHTLDLSHARLAFTFSRGAEAGVLTAYQDEMARNIIGLREVSVRDVLVPLKKVRMADNATLREDFLDLVRSCGFSRIPIWQGRRSSIIGMVHVFDVLAEDRPGLTIRNYIREVPEVPPTASIYQALLSLQASRTPLGVVKDQGKAIGIVTVTDLIEEIVGEMEPGGPDRSSRS